MFKLCDLKRKYSIVKKEIKGGWTWTLKLHVEQIRMIVDANNYWKYQIRAINDYYKQMQDFVVVETHATILSLGIILAYVLLL